MSASSARRSASSSAAPTLGRSSPRSTPTSPGWQPHAATSRSPRLTSARRSPTARGASAPARRSGRDLRPARHPAARHRARRRRHRFLRGRLAVAPPPWPDPLGYSAGRAVREPPGTAPGRAPRRSPRWPAGPITVVTRSSGTSSSSSTQGSWSPHRWAVSASPQRRRAAPARRQPPPRPARRHGGRRRPRPASRRRRRTRSVRRHSLRAARCRPGRPRSPRPAVGTSTAATSARRSRRTRPTPSPSTSTASTSTSPRRGQRLAHQLGPAEHEDDGVVGDGRRQLERTSGRRRCPRPPPTPRGAGRRRSAPCDASHHSGPDSGWRWMTRRQAVTRPAGSKPKPARAVAVSWTSSPWYAPDDRATYRRRSIGCTAGDDIRGWGAANRLH